MNRTPLINSKHTMILAAIAASCPFVQANTAGYISTSSAAGTSQVGPTAVYAGDSQQDGINAREAARRKARTSEALELLQQGRTCYAQKEYVQALEKYEAAWKVVPKAPVTLKLQEFLVKSIGDASIAVAMEYSRVGRYDEAEQLLLDVLERDPNNKRAREELSLMRDPVRNNPALTPEHVKNVEEVNRLLTLAYGHLDLGNYDAAYDEFNRVIAIDPYNSAARRGQESISKRRSNYYKSAHDSFRAKALAEVDAMWEERIPQEAPTFEVGSTETEATAEGVLRIRDILVSLKIASVNFEETPMEDALEFLRAEIAKSGQSVNFIFKKAAEAPAPAPVAAPSDDEEEEEDDEESEDEEEEEEVAAAAPAAVVTPVGPAIISSLKLQDVTAAELLNRICDLARCEYTVDDSAIMVSQQGAGVYKMERRSWPVRRAFFEGESGEDEEEEEDNDFASSSSRRVPRIDAKASLMDMGIIFPPGSTAKYSPALGQLTVYNTKDELDNVEEVINAFRQKLPRMVKVSAKFVEISQTNEEELSFDWVVNPFSISDSGRTYLGGVNGTNSLPDRLVQDFVNSGGNSYSNNYSGMGSWPINSQGALTSATDTITNGLMTGGLRSGSGAITSGALQNLITSGSAGQSATATAAPGVMSLSGIYDSGSYQMIMRGLSQKKGVDVMSAPSLVISGLSEMTHAPVPDSKAIDQSDESGCAKIEVVRRFVYPDEYQEPQIPDDPPGNVYEGSSQAMPVAAPANPSNWAVEDVGVMLRFKVQNLNDGDADIVHFERFEIRVVDFEGFVNYGSPITCGIANNSVVEHVVLTENRIDMPIFSRRYINTNPCVYDGHTIAIGGLMQDEVQKVEDKVPVFGDLPLIGRLFRSNAESHIRKNLMVFVTADIIDPFGKPMRSRETGSGPAPSTVPGLFPDDGLAKP